jgi:hypothetical protein
LIDVKPIKIIKINAIFLKLIYFQQQHLSVCLLSRHSSAHPSISINYKLAKYLNPST